MTTVRQEPVLMSTTAAARAIGCSAQHIRNQARRGEIRSQQFGHKLLIPTSEVRRLAGADADSGHEALSSQTSSRGHEAILKDIRRLHKELDRLYDELEG